MNKTSAAPKLTEFVAKTTVGIRKAKKILLSDSGYRGLPVDYPKQAASDLICDRLLDSQPCMISRLGTVELQTILCYLNIQRKPKFALEKQISYLARQTPKYWWSNYRKLSMSKNAGFFPATAENLDRFARLYLEDIRNIDIIGSWLKEEREIVDLLSDARVVTLGSLQPWEHQNPWSRALEDKTVLVIHPFAESIQNQYRQREHLFKDKRVLPKFELKTLPAVQSIAGNKTPFDSWFKALDWMCDRVSQTQFDIAIIGAGAYGLPLASHVKKVGKKSVHLGGATQLLFGIKGKRWEEENYLQKISNQYWVRPLPSEMPANFQYVEGGCYW